MEKPHSGKTKSHSPTKPHATSQPSRFSHTPRLTDRGSFTALNVFLLLLVRCMHPLVRSAYAGHCHGCGLCGLLFCNHFCIAPQALATATACVSLRPPCDFKRSTEQWSCLLWIGTTGPFSDLVRSWTPPSESTDGSLQYSHHLAIVEHPAPLLTASTVSLNQSLQNVRSCSKLHHSTLSRM